jgi:hypothetical protein
MVPQVIQKPQRRVDLDLPMHKDPHREVHAKSRMEDRGSSVQSLTGSSSSHLPWGAPSASSLPSPPPAAVIKKASSSIRQTKDAPPGEPEMRPAAEVMWIFRVPTPCPSVLGRLQTHFAPAIIRTASNRQKCLSFSSTNSALFGI